MKKTIFPKVLFLAYIITFTIISENSISSLLNTSGEINKFKLESVAPKIFSPSEGDKVSFSYVNPNFAEVSIRIFDVTGAEVRKNIDRENENTMIWDGKDKDRNTVLGGIYIYQVEADGEVINGTIIVVR
ncbi:MAG: gliding motility-associated C-terminal domain-containing protein [Elusimicrobia bacterium]|nr:gliding motility-associated C-terminal domain-containing protein [Elusimicrobiota bacterium]